MTRLHVVLDQMVAPVPGGIGRYTVELTRALIRRAPEGADVDGLVSAVSASTRAAVADQLPGISGVTALPLERRLLARAWQAGLVTGVPRGSVHAPSLLAPLGRAGARRTAVTVHDAVPWTHPETLTPRGVAWHRAMAERAARFADAIVVPTHAVAEELREYVDFGDRVRVIGGAVAEAIAVPPDADARAAALGLPPEYVVAVGTLEPRKGLGALIRALSSPRAPSVPLVVVGPAGWGDVDVEQAARDAGLEPGRVITTGKVSDADLAVALSRADAFVMPSLAEGFGLPVLEAMSLGTPVIHSDVPALDEVAGGAGFMIADGTPDDRPERIAEALADVLGDDDLRWSLAARGLERSRAYSWSDSADRVWSLHAEL